LKEKAEKRHIFTSFFQFIFQLFMMGIVSNNHYQGRFVFLLAQKSCMSVSAVGWRRACPPFESGQIPPQEAKNGMKTALRNGAFPFTFPLFPSLVYVGLT
jgi:hypothetical protein